MTCATGVLDSVQCACITFDSASSYTDVVNQFNNISQTLSSSGQSSSTLSASMSEAQTSLANLTQYIQDNQGNLNQTYISFQLDYIKSKMAALSVSVNAFTSNLAPAKPTCGAFTCKNDRFTKNVYPNCYCSCSLSCAADMVSNYQSCQCSAYADFSTFTSAWNSMNNLFSSAIYDMRNSAASLSFMSQINTMRNYGYGIWNELQNGFDDLDLAAETLKIQQFMSNMTSMQSSWSSSFTCNSSCQSYSLQIQDCSCASNSNVT